MADDRGIGVCWGGEEGAKRLEKWVQATLACLNGRHQTSFASFNDGVVLAFFTPGTFGNYQYWKSGSSVILLQDQAGDGICCFLYISPILKDVSP